MNPEHLIKAGEVIAYLAIGAGGLFGVQWTRARRNGHSNGELKQILFEVSDRNGSVRSHGHQAANALQILVGRMELMQGSSQRAEEYLKKIADTLVELRLEAAERGNCCAHCPGRG